jgi:hypothetical protein
MGIGRSTYYDAAPAPTDDTAIVEAIAAICEEFECYGWRRVRAALRQQGMIVNHKKIKRLMCEHGLQPRIRRRYVATTDSDHDQPIFPNRTKDVIVDRPDRLWVADITYVAIAVGFAYVAVILDAWSRRVVGYAISRSIDARLTMAALKSAVERRKPPPGCMHHSDSQRINASSRLSIRSGTLSRPADRPRPRRLDGPARQSIRQRQGGELHENHEGRGGLSDGIRNVRRRRREPSELHRGGLQQAPFAFRARLS